ncbi:MinD/ParA family ATP-binding protein [Celerinatantimonas diazotrophica]|jgi:flagellar biosynthesis protein FlhG|uniref:Flagellar biosynthesis protein FlhG n=1 Tax=Celerinatantimonas diazotrophica TaxID=412034 RepID=A0A4R1JNM1_9GAMM|nr:MinD/ParA family protein [Celerinatantimonas diazotrophica]TCK52119.1 flagellar biosynthesis protein FlhG [Celerinatantimonas diazotrophica]CAG9296176.1 Flagellum site-determining protein YlxH [Celerinatantimonas diazotrophica]
MYNNYLTQFNQASGLKMMQKNKKVKVIAVTGGKGGVGKTNVTLNMAVAMAAQGKRVMVLDADLGLANVDVMLGLRVTRNLSHVLRGECQLEDILVEGPNGILIAPATSGTQSMVELSQTEHAGLIRAFSELKTPIDVLLVDTAAGISEMVLSFSRAAQDILVVVCDEPTSITDAYALIKILSNEHGCYKFKIVANMVHNLREGQELYTKLTRVTDRFLDATLELVACIPYDNNVRQAVRKQKVIVDGFPKSPASLAFRSLASKAASWPIPDQARGHLEFFIESLLNTPGS